MGERGFIRGGAGQSGGVNAGFFQNIRVIGKTNRLNGIRETDNAVLVDIGRVGVGRPRLAAHIGAQSGPVGEIARAAVDENIRHIPGLIIAFERSLNINAAAHGFNFHMDARFFLVHLRQFFERRVHFDFAVDKADRRGGGVSGVIAFPGVSGVTGTAAGGKA